MNSVLDLWLSNESSGTSLIELEAILWDSRHTNDDLGTKRVRLVSAYITNPSWPAAAGIRW